jgi:twitching motility protein PilT
MSLVPSLLQAIVSIDGEALVMHAGDKPYVLAPSGQVELASKGLTLDAVSGIVSQLLPPEVFNALDEFGSIQHELAAQPGFSGESFTVVAARGGDDVWVEIRRKKIHDDDRVPDDVFGPPPPGTVSASAEIDDSIPDLEITPAAAAPAPPASSSISGASLAAASSDSAEEQDLSLSLPDAGQLFGSEPAASREPEAVPPPVALAKPAPLEPAAVPPPAPKPAPVVAAPPPPKPAPVVAAPPPPKRAPVVAAPPPAPKPVPVAPVASAPAVSKPLEPVAPKPVAPPPKPSAAPVTAPIAAAFPPSPVPPPRVPVAPPPVAAAPTSPPVPTAPVSIAPVVPLPIAPAVSTPIQPPPIVAPPAITLQPDPVFRAPAPPLAPVLPLTRSPVRTDTPAPIVATVVPGLDRLLRMVATRGASTLYLSSGATPSIRVDGEIQALEGETQHGPNDVESLLLTMIPERNHEAMRMGQATEWITDLEGVGRVRCMSFRDHRGPGGIFRMMPVRAVSTDQLGLTREVQSLAIEPEGIVLIAGPRLSGKRTMISAFVDLMNRTRRDHVITIEHEINVVHERGTSFISQREVRGGYEEVESVARAALREDPDVLVIESMRTAPLINVALEAAASGQLVIGGFPAHDTTTAIDRIINLYPPEYRRQVQLGFAENLRGVVAQVLLPKNGGGRLAAREILLNNPAVSGIIAEGRTSQLPLAIDGGRRQGMQPLNDALAGLVQGGSVDVRDAYRRAADRAGFLALLKRLGMDTTLIERAG